MPIVIVGATATGKSALAMALADRWLPRFGPVEIVSVDSMQVYRGMDIGTAKPTVEQRAQVPHHLIDVLDPWDECELAWFQRHALTAVAQIDSRDHRALLVGGTGLYHRAVVDGLDVPGQYPEVRSELEQNPDTEALHQQLAALDPLGATRMEPTNRRRVVRALEVSIGSGRPFSAFGPGLEQYPQHGWPMIGLRCDRAVQANQLATRVRAMIAAGLVVETERLWTHPNGMSRTALQALGYREVIEHLRGECSLAAAVDATIVRTRQFAVRQERWFRRDPRIVWFDSESPDLVDQVAGTVERS